MNRIVAAFIFCCSACDQGAVPDQNTRDRVMSGAASLQRQPNMPIEFCAPTEPDAVVPHYAVLVDGRENSLEEEMVKPAIDDVVTAKDGAIFVLDRNGSAVVKLDSNGCSSEQMGKARVRARRISIAHCNRARSERTHYGVGA